MRSSILLMALSVLLTLTCLSSHAADGPDVADQLNARYKLNPDECTGQTPAYKCSGVLIRGFREQRPIAFWLHDATAMRLGAEAFAFLRADVSTRQLPYYNGVVFADLDSGTAQQPQLDVLCAYPFNLSPGIDWLGYGCVSPSNSQQIAEDPSSCPSAITDPANWLEDFASKQNDRKRQCSLSTQTAASFRVSLQAHEGINESWSSTANLLMIKSWGYTRPEALPVQAIVYEKGVRDSLSGAHRDQLAYFKATGLWLPVLQINLADQAKNVFVFDVADQLYVGYGMAAKLNERYMDSRPICPDGKPAFYCNGILLRGVWASSNHEAWNPSPGSIANNGVSFSYLRHDLPINVMFGYSGLIFKEAAAPAATPITVRCGYPFEAGTSGSDNPCTFRGVCEEMGITSVEQWSVSDRRCAFTNSAEQFKVLTDIRNELTIGVRDYNEIMVAAWPQAIPDEIPLEALVHRADWPGIPSLAQTQYIQRRFLLHTGRFLPMLSMDQTDYSQPIFSYDPALQNQPGAPETREMRDGVPVELNEQEMRNLQH